MIASCMDLIVAADDAQFLPAHLQLFTAPWDLGVRKAKQILYENRFIPAAEALELGLVCEVVPKAQLMESAIAQAQRIASNDALTLRMLKQSINAAEDAMGYRNSVQNAHSNYMMMQLAGSVRRKDSDTKEHRLGGVAMALEKERLKEENQGKS